MRAKTGWDIRPANMAEFLEKIRTGEYDETNVEANTTFTILKNARRNETEIAELVAATGVAETGKRLNPWPAAKMVTLPLERLVLFETVAALETEIQMKEDDLKPLVQDVYRNHMKPSEPGKPSLKQMETAITKAARWESLQIMEEVKEALLKDETITLKGAEAEAHKTCQTIETRLISGKYKPKEMIYDAYDNILYDPDKNNTISPVKARKIALVLTEKIVNDKCYMQQAENTAKKYVDDKLTNIINKSLIKYPETDKALQRLSTHTGGERHTFMLAGAPACGKGTIITAMEVQAKEQFNVDWDNTVKINTDNHREIVSSAASLGDDITIHSDLNDFEAAYITDRANARVQAQLDENKGHHLVIDGVYPSTGRFKMGTQNDGSLHVACVSVPVDVSVERAFKRGQEIGRFVGSEYLVSSHKFVSKDLLENMVKSCTNTNAELFVFNTNVPRGTQPIQAMQLDMSTKEAIIYDADAMAEIYGKKNIKSDASDSTQVYPKGQEKFDYSYNSELESLGVTVKFDTPEMQQKVEELTRSTASMSLS